METKLNDQESLREFLEEAELMHYFELFRDILKVGKLSQLRYVALEDLAQIGLSKPEQRRYKKIYSKRYPNTYITRLKKLLHVHKKNEEIQYGREIVASDEPELKISRHIISIEDITINKELGGGQFGVVQQGTWTTGRQRIQVAIKCLGHERMTSNSTEFLKEAAVMHSVEHENIVRLYGVVLHLDSLMLVTELAPLRSLLECLREVSLRSNFPVTTLCEFATQICTGMSYLEQKRLIHRDLAARNILVFSKNKVKISDFGLSRALGAGKDYYQTNYNVNLKLPVAWCAPECILYLRFTSASDVWAYGVCLWEMFTYGFQPWVAFSGQQILEAIDAPKYQRLERPECCPDAYYELMLKCWSHNASDRPKFRDIVPRLQKMTPEKVMATMDFRKPAAHRSCGFLEFNAGDIITVIGKDSRRYGKTPMWYGTTEDGGCGLFDPTCTRPYSRVIEVRQRSPSPPAQRGSLLRSEPGRQTRRLDSSMISGPQPDVRHIGHVGQDGAYFGNVPILESTLSPLQRPSTSYRVDDAEPLLNPHSPSHAAGSATPYPLLSASRDTADNIIQAETNKTNALMKALKSVSEPTTSKSLFNKVKYATLGRSTKNDTGADKPADEHEYHEISDTDTESIAAEMSPPEGDPESPGPSNYLSGDYGQALLQQIDNLVTMHDSDNGEAVGQQDAKGEKKDEKKEDKKETKKDDKKETKKGEGKEEKREEKKIEKEEKKQEEAAAAAKASCSDDTICTMKPMSSHDVKTLDTACALANELTSKMNGMEAKSPGSASDKRFPFKRALSSLQNFSGQDNEKEGFAGRPERRNFSDEARSVPDLQATLTEESRRAYTSLIEQPPAPLLGRVEPASGQARLKQLRLYTPEPCTSQPGPSQPRTLPRTAIMLKPVPLPDNNFRSLPKPTYKPRLPTPPSDDDDEPASPPLPVPPRSSKPKLVDRPRHVRRHPLLEEDVLDLESLQPPPNIYENALRLGPTNTVSVIAIENFPPNPFEVVIPPLEGNPFGPYLGRHDIVDEDQAIFEMVELRKTSEHVSVEDLLEFAGQKPTPQERGVESDEVRILLKVLKQEVSPEACLEALQSCNWNIHSAIKLCRVKKAIAGKAEASDTTCLEVLEMHAGDYMKAAAFIIENQD